MTASHQTRTVERRRDVRVRPAADYEVKVELLLDDLETSLQVVDISVGGMSVLVSRALAESRVGDDITLSLSVRGGDPFQVKANVRHIGPPGFGVCGVQFQDLGDAARAAIRRCVSDLLERGQHF
jgi:c-di-GMP-binding flagellar brake protein YcgR